MSGANNAANMNQLLRNINRARRANLAPLNPGAPAWNPPARALDPAAPEWRPRGMNPAAPVFVPEIPDSQVMNAYLREINTTRRANMPAQRRRKSRRANRKNNRKSRKSRK